jgi:hypothetical protein
LIVKYSEDSAYRIAKVYTVCGEVNRAIEWLEGADARREGGLIEMQADPRLRSLHGDQHWGAFLKEVGLGD